MPVTGYLSEPSTQESRPTDLVRCVARLVKALDRGLAPIVAPHGIMTVELGLLRACLAAGPTTATSLGKVLPSDASYISRMVDRMVRKKILSRRRSRSDRRVVILELTEKGRAMTLHLHELVRDLEQRLFEGATEEEVRGFFSMAHLVMRNQADLEESR